MNDVEFHEQMFYVTKALNSPHLFGADLFKDIVEHLHKYVCLLEVPGPDSRSTCALITQAISVEITKAMLSGSPALDTMIPRLFELLQQLPVVCPTHSPITLVQAIGLYRDCVSTNFVVDAIILEYLSRYPAGSERPGDIPCLAGVFRSQMHKTSTYALLCAFSCLGWVTAAEVSGLLRVMHSQVAAFPGVLRVLVSHLTCKTDFNAVRAQFIMSQDTAALECLLDLPVPT